MSDLSKDDLAAFAELLAEFSAAQRAGALSEAKRQRVIVARHVGDSNVQFETLVDEGASAADIFKVLEPLDGAIDRLKAKIDLSSHYERMANFCGQIEMSANKMRSDAADFHADNARRNQNRRTPIVMTDAQRKTLDGHRGAIQDAFERIAELKKAASECRRVLDGADPFEVLDAQIEARLNVLRAARPDAA